MSHDSTVRSHDAALRIIVGLMPEIEKKGAERVLADYAEKEDLPPAQLEKLAQVFNTLRQVSHIEKAADRGSNVPLIDVPELVIGYVLSHGGPEKAARIDIAVPTHDIGSVDLMSALRNEIAGPRQARELDKAASSAPDMLCTPAQFREAALDLSIDARLDMEKFAGLLLGSCKEDADGLISLTRAVTEARRQRADEWVEKSAAWLCRASARKVVPVNFTEPLVKRAFDMSSAAGDLMVQFVDAFALHTAMTKLAVGAPVHPGPDSEADRHLQTAHDPLAHPDNAPHDAAYYDRMAEQAMAAEQGAGGQHDDPTATTADDRERARSAAGGRVQAPSDGGDGAPTKNTGTKGDKVADKATGIGGILQGLWHGVTAPVHAAADGMGRAADAARDMLTHVTSKERTNKAQMHTDANVDDIRRSINVRRMIGTDDVLKEADPREVLEIYNAVARTNPEIAHNMAAVKLLLREAVSYQGLTLDAQKQLADIRKSTGDAEGKESDNLKRRYTAGSALLPNVSVRA